MVMKDEPSQNSFEKHFKSSNIINQKTIKCKQKKWKKTCKVACTKKKLESTQYNCIVLGILPSQQ
jgi:hypothetical protein